MVLVKCSDQFEKATIETNQLLATDVFIFQSTIDKTFFL